MATGVDFIKICGITSVEDAKSAVAAGTTAIGLNFVPSSPRYLEPGAARQLILEVGRDVEWIGVIADLEVESAVALQAQVGLDWLQLHGSEDESQRAAIGDRAYKALRIASAADVRAAESYAGERLLVDAKVDGMLGGSGHAFDWALVEGLARRRRLILAGGLHPGNVVQASRQLRPWGLDVASGVENAPGVKDASAMARFVAGARLG